MGLIRIYLIWSTTNRNTNITMERSTEWALKHQLLGSNFPQTDVIGKDVQSEGVCSQKTKIFSLQPAFHVLRGQSLPNITKAYYLNPCSYSKLIHTDWRREVKKEREEGERETKAKIDSEKTRWRERRRQRRREVRDGKRWRRAAPLGCSGLWDRPIDGDLNTVSHCASALSPRQPTVWPQTQS